MQLVITAVLLLLIALGWYLWNSSHSDGGSMNPFGSTLAVLSRYSRDLTLLAKEKKLDPVVGRKAEIERVIQILSRRNKNNPVLIGKAGIGKTAIVEGLALEISGQKVPPALFNKRVLALDLPGILAGTKYRGEFEQRLKKITEEIVASHRNIILFIDEIHILAEAGEAEGAINAADILKPMLARGELQVVGATTEEEYDKFIKKDKTLDRRLQPIFVSEPKEALVFDILNGVKAVYEDYHKVTVSEKAIKEAISSTRKITNRAYPDKAIDALDEACSKVRLAMARAGKHDTIPTVGPKDIDQVVKQWTSRD